MRSVTLICLEGDLERQLNLLSNVEQKLIYWSEQRKKLKKKIRQMEWEIRKWKLNVGIVKENGITKG